MSTAEVFSSAALSPSEVLAADSVEFRIVLTIGPGYTTGASRIVFDFPGEVGMSRPSRMHQEDYGFIETYVSNPKVTYEQRTWDMEIGDFPTRERSSWRGMAARMAVLDLAAGLEEGDTIEVHWGEACFGFGPGTRITHVVPCPDYKDTIHVRYFVDPEAGVPDYGRSFHDYVRPEPDCEIPLDFSVRSRAARELRLIRMTDRALLLPLDPFANVAGSTSADVFVESEAEPVRNSHEVYEYADKDVQIRSRGLPLREGAPMSNVFEGMNVYWGDVHTHSAFSNDCIEREKMTRRPGDLMRFARERAGLDFFAVTDHHEPHHIRRGYKNGLPRNYWEDTIDAVRTHDKAGELLVFPGFEYRCPRGDTVCLFNWLPTFEEIDREDWTDVREVWKDMAGKEFLSIAHFHNPGGLADGDWWSNDGFEPVLEIFSCHGSYERADALEHRTPLVKSKRADRYGVEFLRKGHRYGFVCNSDDHKGHVGYNGVTAVFAPSLDKASILDAYRKRHVYGTTNARIRLVFAANGKLMGSVLPCATESTLAIDVVGESGLKKVDVFRNGDLYKRFCPDSRVFGTELTVETSEPCYYYVRVTQLDNHMAYSSPVWFE